MATLFRAATGLALLLATLLAFTAPLIGGLAAFIYLGKVIPSGPIFQLALFATIFVSAFIFWLFLCFLVLKLWRLRSEAFLRMVLPGYRGTRFPAFFIDHFASGFDVDVGDRGKAGSLAVVSDGFFLINDGEKPDYEEPSGNDVFKSTHNRKPALTAFRDIRSVNLTLRSDDELSAAVAARADPAGDFVNAVVSKLTTVKLERVVTPLAAQLVITVEGEQIQGDLAFSVPAAVPKEAFTALLERDVTMLPGRTGAEASHNLEAAHKTAEMGEDWITSALGEVGARLFLDGIELLEILSEDEGAEGRINGRPGRVYGQILAMRICAAARVTLTIAPGSAPLEHADPVRRAE